MTNKLDMNDSEYKIYETVHNYEHPQQEEADPDGRQKSNTARYRRKHHTTLKRDLGKIARPDDVEDWEDDQALEAYEFMAEREIRNAKTQKQRMKRQARRDSRDSD